MIRLADDIIDIDEIYGPLPNFNETFEYFFTKKAADLLYNNTNCKIKPIKDQLISLITCKNNNNFEWMYNVQLAKNSREQNLEIIYNNKLVYYKVIKKIFKNEYLYAFPTKDLEISLGLQFIPFKEEMYFTCKKCDEILKEQFCLMLHSRYFCSRKSTLNESLLKRKITDLNNNRSKITRYDNNKQEYQPIQLTTVTNQLNINKEQQQNVKVNILNQTTSSSLNNYNDQNSINYTKYIQNFQMLLPSSSYNIPYINNDVSKLLGLTNFTSLFSLPQIMMNNRNNDSQINKELNSNKESRNKLTKTIKKESKTSINKIHQLEAINQKESNNKNKNIDLVTSLNIQSLQNCCAKCNTQFRLTGDLVYHMRTVHKREDTTAFQNNKSKVVKDKQYLICEICNENFKERHHLTRHMTSHR